MSKLKEILSFNWFSKKEAESKQESKDDDVNKEQWSSRAGFILACIGSAVGLSNVWRFPALAEKFGGGPFLIPYFLGFVFIGVPLLLLELAIGQLYQKGPINSFTKINKRLTGLGITTGFNSFLVAAYYMVILAWVLSYTIKSFYPTIPFVSEPDKYFEKDLLMSNDLSFPTVISFELALCLLAIWMIIFSCMVKGVSTIGKILVYVMPIPFTILAIMIIRGATLPGAIDGIYLYVGRWELKNLANPGIWLEAITQIFFSTGVTMGCMISYASYVSKHQNTVQDAVIIVASNSITEFLAGFAVFSIIGYLTKIGEQDVAKGGYALAFTTYTIALSKLPWSNVFMVMFFLSLLLLGLSSAFGMVETIAIAFTDSRKFKNATRVQIILLICVCSFILGLLFVSNIGYDLITAVDYFVNNFIMLTIGLMETVAVGWFYGKDLVIRKIGKSAFYFLFFGYFGSVLIAFNLFTLTEWYYGLGFGLFLIIIVFALTFYLAEDNKSELDKNNSLYSVIFLGSVEIFREDMNEVYLLQGKWTIPLIFSISIRWIIPTVLYVLKLFSLKTLFSSERDPQFPVKFVGVGVTFYAIALCLILFYFVFHRYNCVWLSEDDESGSNTPKPQE